MSAKVQWKVPVLNSDRGEPGGRFYEAAGSIVPYARGNPSSIDWLPRSYTFCAQLKLESVARGRSSAVFWWRDPDHGQRHPMFLSDMLDVAQKRGIAPGGIVSGRWEVHKRGTNYGIALVFN